MTEIKHRLIIKTIPGIVYKAITTQEGLTNWWAKQTTAKPEAGFVNVFTFGKYRNEMKVTKLIPDNEVEWECINTPEKEWMDTKISFVLEEKDERTILRFSHDGWKAATDTFASCNYDWALFMKSLKSYCENGMGTPA